MNNSVEKLAKTVDEAIEEALADLGIASEDAIIEVLDEGDPGGLLGFGRRPARVLIDQHDVALGQMPLVLSGYGDRDAAIR